MPNTEHHQYTIHKLWTGQLFFREIWGIFLFQLVLVFFMDKLRQNGLKNGKIGNSSLKNQADTHPIIYSNSNISESYNAFMDKPIGCKQFLLFENDSYFSKTKFRKFGFFKLKMTVVNQNKFFLLILIKYG